MYEKLRIIKRKMYTDPASVMYVLQREGYSGVLAGQAMVQGGFIHQGAVWSDISSHASLEAARAARRAFETGLKPGEEIVE